LFRKEPDFDDGFVGGGLTAASAFCELSPFISIDESATAKTARSRVKVHNETDAGR
jgi:hypothetical protein